MNTRLEVQLNKTVIVIGPDVTISLLEENNESSVLPPLSFESVRRILIEHESSDRHGESILQRACTSNVLQQSSATANVIVRVQELQRQGALLAYLYPDNVLDTAMKQEPLTATLVDQWSVGNGVMHVFGSCNDVDSMQPFENSVPCVPDSILRVFSDKVCVCVGFTSNTQSDLDVFLSQLQSCTTKVLVAYESELPDSSIGLPVAVKSISEAVYPLGDTSKALGGMIEHFTNELGCSVSFLMASKTDYVSTAMLLSRLPGMNFQFMSNIEHSSHTFHVLTVQIDSKRFSEFWYAVMRPSVIETLVKSTVLAISLDQYTFIWLNGERLIIPVTQSSVEELNCSMNSTSSSSSLPQELNFGISSVLKQHKTLPRYTVRKQKIDSKFTPNDSTFSSSVFRRRMSLPPNTNLAMAATATNTVVTKGKSSLPPVSSPGSLSKQQLLLTRYLHNQRKNETISSTDRKEDCKILRHLLQEKKAEYAKPSDKAMKFLSDWIVKKRKDLYISENHEWSNQISDDLVKKMAKWQRIREKRLAYMKKRQNEEERNVRRSSLDSSASSSSDSLRHHLSTVPVSGYAAPIQSPLLATVNPYLLPQQGTTSFTAAAAGIRTAATATPMLYQSPYLSSYPLLAAPIPLPYLIPGASNLVLVSNNNSIVGTGGGCITTPPTTVSTSGTSLKPHTTGIPLSSTPASSSFLSPPPSTVNGSSPINLADVKPKRKRSNPEKPASVISSLLMSKELTPASKKSRMVSSPASVSDDKSSDGEESMSSSPETEESSLSLWKFLLELLLSNSYSHLIDWNRIHALEFHVKQPQEIAKLWSNYKSDSSIDCTRFKKALRYYCTKEQPILFRVQGRDDHVYQFSPSMLYYINNRYSQFQRHNLSPSTIPSSALERAQDMCGSQEVLVVD